AEKLYVQDLGVRLIDQEQIDIENIVSGLTKRKQKVPADNPEVAHSMPGMLSAQQLKVLEGLSGAEFDESWLTVLSRHLAFGTEMAERIIGDGKHEPTARLAREMIKNQRNTIKEIAQLLDGSPDRQGGCPPGDTRPARLASVASRGPARARHQLALLTRRDEPGRRHELRLHVRCLRVGQRFPGADRSDPDPR